MCFDVDSSPPIPRLSGGSVSYEDLVLTADDANEFAAFAAGAGSDIAVLVLPDVRGLYRFYEELALRFAEHGTDALAIDYFGRTAGVAKRPGDWDYLPEVKAMTLDGLVADARAGIEYLRRDDPDRPIFTVGFCLGGSNSWYLAASALGLSGAVGFYGNPAREGMPIGAPTVISLVGEFTCPVLALQAGVDPGIPVDVDDEFRDAMDSAGATGEVVVYRDAPHSFFDRKAADFAAESADAWEKVQTFLRDHTP